jgi:adenylate cyclase
VLAEFPSAVNAVQCAVEAQHALRDASEGMAKDRRVLFRIGIHVGDAIVRGGDLLGSLTWRRGWTLADAGGIVLSAHRPCLRSQRDYGEQSIHEGTR